MLLAGRIFSGVWSEGQYLPSEYDIAKQVGVSESTVRKALDRLANGALIVREQGKGTRVSDNRWVKLRDRLDRIRLGSDHTTLSWTWTELAYSITQPSDDVSKVLELAKGAETHHLHGLRTATEGAASEEHVWLPVEVVPEFDVDEKGHRHAVILAARHKICPGSTSEMITLVTADKQVAERLGVTAGTPILKCCRVLRSGPGDLHAEGRPIEYRIGLVNLAGGHYQAMTS